MVHILFLHGAIEQTKEFKKNTRNKINLSKFTMSGGQPYWMLSESFRLSRRGNPGDGIGRGNILFRGDQPPGVLAERIS